MEDEAYPTTQPQVTGVGVRNEPSVVSTDHNVQQGQSYGSNAQSVHEQQQQSVNPSTVTPSLDMSSMTAALPDYMYRQIPQNMYQQPYAHPTQNSPMLYHYQGAHYPGTLSNNYAIPYTAQMHSQNFVPQRSYAPYPINSNLSSGQQIFHGQPFYHQQAGISPSVQGSFASLPQSQAFGHAQGSMYGQRGIPHYQGSQIRVDGFGNPVAQGQTYLPGETQDVRRESASSLKVPSALRGPPRKPKQSGHALWVGNLPPGTNIMDLKDHFSRDATNDIESVFLISKSNCAFVNYKSEQSCTAAMGRFHDSRFNGVRLVCRLRRGSSPTSAMLSTVSGAGTSSEISSDAGPVPNQAPVQEEVTQESTKGGEDASAKPKVKERYFIIKSLTVDDLERSVHSGIWATQSHNEQALNKAYQSAENVYLIFSANKSGEYFGYARMESAIDSESVAAIETASIEVQTPQQPSMTSEAELPLTIPTPATATAPKGYIIDDSARGTIFWEAEPTTPQSEANARGLSPADTDSGNVSGDDLSEGQLKSPSNSNPTAPDTTFGNPFKISWLSTDRLPFYRTRGLRNPWNTNREVKIARDGTELEPGVGRKLVAMFSSNAAAGRSQLPGQFPEPMIPMSGQNSAYRPY